MRRCNGLGQVRTGLSLNFLGIVVKDSDAKENLIAELLMPTALLSDFPGIPSGGRFVIYWREEDLRHAISGKIADGFYGR